MMTDIIYLAGGNSKRFGRNKLLENFGGRPLFSHGFQVLYKIAEERSDVRLTVVTQYKELLPFCRDAKVILSENCRKGLSYTVKEGIKNTSDNDYFLFCVADQPFISGKTITELLSCADGKNLSARAYYKDVPGNPVLLNASLKGEIEALEGDRGCSAIAEKYKPVKIFTSEKELSDGDTPEELSRIKEKYK